MQLAELYNRLASYISTAPYGRQARYYYIRWLSPQIYRPILFIALILQAVVSPLLPIIAMDLCVVVEPSSHMLSMQAALAMVARFRSDSSLPDFARF